MRSLPAFDSTTAVEGDIHLCVAHVGVHEILHSAQTMFARDDGDAFVNDHIADDECLTSGNSSLLREDGRTLLNKQSVEFVD